MLPRNQQLEQSIDTRGPCLFLLALIVGCSINASGCGSVLEGSGHLRPHCSTISVMRLDDGLLRVSCGSFRLLKAEISAVVYLKPFHR